MWTILDGFSCILDNLRLELVFFLVLTVFLVHPSFCFRNGNDKDASLLALPRFSFTIRCAEEKRSRRGVRT